MRHSYLPLPCTGLRSAIIGMVWLATLVSVGRAEEGQVPPPLNAAQAKAALLAMIETKAGQAILKGPVPQWVVKAEPQELENGWFGWTGLFNFHPQKTEYKLTIFPREGVRACIFQYRGAFVWKDDRWIATPPELVFTALKQGK